MAQAREIREKLRAQGEKIKQRAELSAQSFEYDQSADIYFLVQTYGPLHVSFFYLFDFLGVCLLYRTTRGMAMRPAAK